MANSVVVVVGANSVEGKFSGGQIQWGANSVEGNSVEGAMAILKLQKTFSPDLSKKV